MVEGVGLGQPRVDAGSTRIARLDTAPLRQTADAPSEKGAGGDEVAISLDARLMQRAQQAVASAPDVRQDKVAELKQQIASGQYQVSPDKIARRMLDVVG
jgi:negative regulator of flagellin synthesis FlgM